MPIDIIPKPPEEEPVWLNILFYIAIGLLVSVILSYFLLGYLQRNTDQILEDIEATLQITQTPGEKELERSILDYQKKINDFSLIFKQHQVNSNVFPLLEEAAHPEVIFSSFNLTKPSVQLSGQAESFVVLNQQLSIFQKNPKILNTNLSQISFGEEGKTNFTFTLTLSPEIFKFK